MFICMKPFNFPLVLVKYLCLNSLSTLPVLSWLSENGSVFTEIFKVFTRVWFFWALFVESKNNICLFCLCMGFVALNVAKELAMGRIMESFFFLIWIGKIVMVVVKTGVLQCGDKPRFNVVAAAWAQGWSQGCPTPDSLWRSHQLGFEVVVMVFPCPKAPLFVGVADLHSCWIFPVVLRAVSMYRSQFFSACSVLLHFPCILHLSAMFQEIFLLCHPIPGTPRAVWIPLQFLVDNPSVPSLCCFWRNAWFQKALLTSGGYLHSQLILVLVSLLVQLKEL